ncbi:MAG: hypothetical protein AAF502_14590 [Bacteroidota bacterium]
MNAFFQDLTFKQKNKYLLIGSFLFCLMIFFSAIQPTFRVFNEYHKVTRAIDQAGNMDADIQKMQAILSASDNQSIPFNQDVLLESLTYAAQQYGLMIKAYPKPGIWQQQGFTFEINAFEVVGSYQAIVQMVYDLEQVHDLGDVVSLKIQTKENRQTKKSYLSGIITLKNVLKSDES